MWFFVATWAFSTATISKLHKKKNSCLMTDKFLLSAYIRFRVTIIFAVSQPTGLIVIKLFSCYQS